MVAALVVIALVEGFAREDVYWRPLAIFPALAIAFVQLLRRRDPLLAASLAFGPSAVAQGLALALDVRPMPDPELSAYVISRAMVSLVHGVAAREPERLQHPHYAAELTELLVRFCGAPPDA